MTHDTQGYCQSYYNEIIENNPLLDSKEERRLAKAIIGGKNKQQAREKLFNSNVRLVIKYATKVACTYHVPFEDVMSEGSVGLMNAIDKFNPKEFKTRFSTYACKCISLHLNKAIADLNSRIHVPQNILLKGRKYRALIDKDPEITRHSLKQKLNISEKALVKLENYNAQVLSLSTPISSDGNSDATLESTIEDTKAEDACEYTIKEEEKVILSTALNMLDKDQKDIIKSRYFDDEKKTLSVLGKKYGVSKERVRQIEVAALKKMKRHIKRKMTYNG